MPMADITSSMENVMQQEAHAQLQKILRAELDKEQTADPYYLKMAK